MLPPEVLDIWKDAKQTLDCNPLQTYSLVGERKNGKVCLTAELELPAVILKRHGRVWVTEIDTMNRFTHSPGPVGA